MKHLLFDTETTGLDPKTSFIIENGAILYDDETQEEKRFNNLLNWGLIYKGFTTASTVHVHKITDERLQKEGIHPLKAFADFYDFIKNFGDLDVICAFNIAYDHNMMISNLLNLIENSKEDSEDLGKCIKLLKLLQKSYENDDPNKILFFDCMIFDRLFHFEVNHEKVRHNLEDVGLRYDIPADPNAHNALADTERTLKIYKIQLEELKEHNIALDKHMEERMIKQYKRNQEKWAKKKDNSNAIDYLAFEMTAAKFKV